MSQQAGYSPSFKRPAEIMRMRRKRALSEAGASGPPGKRASSPASVRPFSPGPLLHNKSPTGGGVKRRNPFANIENTFNSPKKRLINYNDEQQDDVSLKMDSGGALASCKRLLEEKQLEKTDTPVSSKKRLTFSEDDSLFDEDDDEQQSALILIKSPQFCSPSSIAPPACTEYPADWSIKTRLLFTSPLPFSWAENLKAQEEATGLSMHCTGQYKDLPHSIQDPRACPELRCSLQQSLQYWQHPSLAWQPLFPRINAQRSFQHKSAPWSQDTALQQSLIGDWAVSLSSLYSLLKAGLCPYFYVCSYQLTVLFRAAGLGGSSSITALLSPTTRGLREAMKAEGIEFTLPLLEERKRCRERPVSVVGEEDRKEEEEERRRSPELKEGKGCHGNPGVNDEDDDYDDDDDDDNDDEDGGFSWLKEMGVQDKIKKPDSISIQLHKERRAVSLDHKPDSVACVAGPHAFTLLNFLLGCRGLVAGAGPQAGLPPTLLAPGPFRGATLYTLKARSVNVKTRVGCSFQDVCSLEVTGPVLPSCLHSLTRLLRPAQKGGFSATLYTHTPTAVFNTHTQEQADGSPPDPSSCGLHPSTVDQLRQTPTLGRTALTHLQLSSYSYTWKN